MAASAEEIENLAENVLEDIELGRISLAAVMLKCARLARWLGDEPHRQIFAYEAGGYPSEPTGVPALVFTLGRTAGRVYREKDKDGAIVERMKTRSVESWERSIEANRAALAVAGDPDVSISSANPSQYVGKPIGNVLERNRLAEAIRSDSQDVASSRAFAYDYATAALYQARFSEAATTIFDRVRQRLDVEIINIAPRAPEKVAAIQDNLASDNPEDWANAVHGCRRLLQEVADTIFPPSEPQQRSGRTVKLGPENYINRLICYIEDHSSSSRFTSIVGTSLEHIGVRLDALFQAAQKGSHANIASAEEAERYVIYTFLMLSDILALHAD